MQRYISGSLIVFIPIISLAIYLRILNALGIEHWAANQIGDFIRQVIEAAS